VFGSTSFSADPPDGTVEGDTSGQDAFGIFAANDATTLVFGVAAIALVFFALMPRVGRRVAAAPDEPETTRTGRFQRGERAPETRAQQRT
jgi:hypothetical protein